jgi:hypothetical protein
VGGKVVQFRRPVQAVFNRAANSVWNLGLAARGFAIERTILGRLPNISTKVANFPVIDDLLNGVATSIKSMDLTAKSYRSATGILNKLSSYAKDLSQFAGRNWGGIEVTAAQMQKKVLLVAVERGAATPAQQQVLKDFVEIARIEWPNIVVKFETVP